jgi:hypothetical protein
MIALILSFAFLSRLSTAGGNNDNLLRNLLQLNGFDSNQITQIQALPRFPLVSHHGEVLPGKQLWVKDDYMMAVIYTIDDEGCCTSVVLYDNCEAKE